MQLFKDEAVIKISRHHPFPLVINVFKIAVVSLPFFFVASFFQGVLDSTAMIMVYLGVGAIFALLIAHQITIFRIDRLVITNERVVYINWKNLFTRKESEVAFENIQDINTIENGILAEINLFDYGLFKIESNSGDAPIVFKNANNPEGMKDFIYHLQIKPSKIEQEPSLNPAHDRKETSSKIETGVARSGFSGTKK